MPKLKFPDDATLGKVYPFLFGMEGGGKHLIDHEIRKKIMANGRCKILEVGLFLGSSAFHWLDTHKEVELIGVDLFARNESVFEYYLNENIGWAVSQLARTDAEAFLRSYKEHGQELIFFKNLECFKDRISIYRGNFNKIIDEIKADHPDVDIVFLDADKRREMIDLAHRCYPDALISGDDWSWGESQGFPMQLAVKAFCNDNHMEWESVAATWKIKHKLSVEPGGAKKPLSYVISNNFIGPLELCKTSSFHQEDHKQLSGYSASGLRSSGLRLNLNPSFFEDLTLDTVNDIGVSSSSSDQNVLNKMFLSYGCNKGIAHNYPSFYNSLFEANRGDVSMFVEIGIGSPNHHEGAKSRMTTGYAYGSSLRGWRDYFGKATVVGVDIDPNVLFEEDRILTCYGDQLNPCGMDWLKAILIANGGADVVLDDGLHEHVSNMNTFLQLWTYLRPGGVYLIEDMSRIIFEQNMAFLKSLSLDGSIFGAELQSAIKSDNRIIAVFKNP